jgi:nitrate/nitrite transport system substrate-binding protein
MERPMSDALPSVPPQYAPRREFLKRVGATVAGVSLAGALPEALRAGAWAQGSDRPEKAEIRIGFIALTDCSSVVMAAVKQFDKKYGIKIIPTKEASWASVRDKLLSGELDMAHVLYGLVYGVQLGLGGTRRDMAVLMTLNQNGQGITLSNKLKTANVRDGEGLRKYMSANKREYTFAQTFPTGTHAMWLYYWLAAHDINPFVDTKVITVPPPQMVANMRIGNMDGYCVGEPWNARAIVDDVGFTATTTQDIWRDHPEKVLGTTADFANKNPNACRAAIAAILDASRYVDTSLATRRETAEVVAERAYVNTDRDVILDRMLGRYTNGLGKTWDDKHAMTFFGDGAVNFPYLSDGMWFLTQHRRWGLLKEDVDYRAIAERINRIDLYKQGAAAAKVAVPKDVMRASKLIDGVVWDGKDPKRYASTFKIKVA